MNQDDAHIQERKNEKDLATAEIAAVLNRLMDERRNPDSWERVHLVYALNSVFRGCYRLARAETDLAMTPPGERSPHVRLPYDPTFDRCDLPLLWQALRAAMAEPVLRHQHLGPIEFTGKAG